MLQRVQNNPKYTTNRVRVEILDENAKQIETLAICKRAWGRRPQQHPVPFPSIFGQMEIPIIIHPCES